MKSVKSGSDGLVSVGPQATSKSSDSSVVSIENEDDVPMYDGELEVNNLVRTFLEVPDIRGIKAKIQKNVDLKDEKDGN